MEELRDHIREYLMQHYGEIIPEDEEKWPGVYLPQVLAEFAQEGDMMHINFHIGVEEGKEAEIISIKERLRKHMEPFGLEAGGFGIKQIVAVNEKSQRFIQQPVRFTKK